MQLSLHKVNVAASQGVWCSHCEQYRGPELWHYPNRDADAECPTCTITIRCLRRRMPRYYWDDRDDCTSDTRPDYFPPPRWIKCCYPSTK